MFEKRKAKNEEDADEVFHFVSYLHFKNSIYEIDGLREGPIMILENCKQEEFLEKVKPSIQNRIMLYAQNELKFNLMALVPNRKTRAEERERDFEEKRKFISKLLFNNTSQNSEEDVEVKLIFI